MHDHPEPLAWIDAQRETMTRLLIDWANINSGSLNLDGLSRQADAIAHEFAPLGGEMRLLETDAAESIDPRGNIVRLPLGRAISITKRADAPVRVLLNIHYDTVYGADHPFQRAQHRDTDTLSGPGVADAKGGIVVMLTALRAIERSSALRERLGWEVLINPDEEIGSPGSVGLLREAAKQNHYGLVFEPATPDGNLIGARRGSATFTVVVRGRAAHAGRDFQLGRSAILALADLIRTIDESQRALGGGVTINCGKIEGGGAVNVVPDLAIARFNARAVNAEEQHAIESLLAREVEALSRRDGISATLHGKFFSPPKPLDERSARLMDQVLSSARELGMNLTHKPGGGACDGNKLVAAGLAVVDTMGVVGGELHSEREYVRLDSLVPRAKLAALALVRLAGGGGGGGGGTRA
jgi:glutamate carboxypeptidase